MSTKTEAKIANLKSEEGNTNSSSSSSKVKKRNYCFTLNNYEAKDIENLTKNFADAKYIFQEETGESGTRHLQGYVEFKNDRSFDAIKKLIPRAHIEPAKKKRQPLPTVRNLLPAQGGFTLTSDSGDLKIHLSKNFETGKKGYWKYFPKTRTHGRYTGQLTKKEESERPPFVSTSVLNIQNPAYMLEEKQPMSNMGFPHL